VSSYFNEEISGIAHVEVLVSVEDENDNPPVFMNTPYIGVIPLDSDAGQQVFRVHAVDMDALENRQISYELHSGDRDLFFVNPSNGAISLLQTIEGLQSNYHIVISAFDNGTPPLSSDASVELKVVDQSMPVFDLQFYMAIVREDILLHTPVISVHAVSQLNHRLIYTIVGGNTNSVFAIDFEHG
ncbi:unnamed protein product, partial [Meganyctiphanes norvegica]